MSHHVYTERGIVLAHRSIREADKTVAILTRELGLVRGEARGVRKSTSKLSTSLTELSKVLVSLVKGKRHWRITTVTLLSDTNSLLRERRRDLTALSKVSALLLKLVHGEDKNPDLFDVFEKAVDNLVTLKPRVEDWELLTVAQILSHLGYLSKSDVPKNFDGVSGDRKRILSLVNSGIRESGLE